MCEIYRKIHSKMSRFREIPKQHWQIITKYFTNHDIFENKCHQKNTKHFIKIDHNLKSFHQNISYFTRYILFYFSLNIYITYFTCLQKVSIISHISQYLPFFTMFLKIFSKFVKYCPVPTDFTEMAALQKFRLAASTSDGNPLS